MQVTDRAREKLQNFLEQRSKGCGVFVTVKTTGCSGYAYHLEFANDQDSLIEVDPKYKYMFEGVILDYVKQGLNEGFEFDNPNEKHKCGCGESFTV
jgi:iron-sulfur cluster assembly protein|tara:strand:+ start:3017 stop:3304 length:288 start_codon:yes stop_codon:yes gene_type:complete